MSLLHGQPGSAKGRKVAILAADGVDAAQVEAVQAALKAEGAKATWSAPSGDADRRRRGQEDVRQHRLGAVRCRVCPRRPGEHRGAEAAVRRGAVHRRGLQARQASGGFRRGRRSGRSHAGGPPARRRRLHARRRTRRLPQPCGLPKNFVDALAHHRFFNRKQAAQVSA